MHNRTWSRLAVAALLSALLGALLVAGCGGGSPRQGAPSDASTTASTASTRNTAANGSSTTTSRPARSGPLAYAECMRANGVPNFPDPQSGGRGRFEIPADVNSDSPAFRTAQTKCQKFMGGLPATPGSTTHPSAQTMAMLRRIAVCMRAHGVPQFPDPRTTVPSNPAGSGTGEITDFDDAILLFPTTIDMQAPAYRQALTACGAPPLGLPP